MESDQDGGLADFHIEDITVSSALSAPRASLIDSFEQCRDEGAAAGMGLLLMALAIKAIDSIVACPECGKASRGRFYSINKSPLRPYPYWHCFECERKRPIDQEEPRPEAAQAEEPETR